MEEDNLLNIRALLVALAVVGLVASCASSTKTDSASARTSKFSQVTEPRAGFSEITEPDGTSTTAVTQAPTTVAPSTTAKPPVSSSAASLIDQLAVAPEGSGAGYDRALFQHWIDADHDGCDTRCEVLEAERRNDLPGLPGGGWLSIYDGYSTDDSSELDIDHVVALGEAWRSGADTWDANRRRGFANDLDEPDALIAVTASTNRSKSDRDPASWQPPNRGAWCQFGVGWVKVKIKWQLTADESEVKALRNMLAGC